MTDMQRRGSLLLGTAVAVMLAVAGPALAAPQLYDGAWIAESFGHDTAGGAGSTFEVTGIPLGVLCNPGAPVCPITQTPTDMGNFKPLGPGCANLSVFGTTVRPAKGGTAITAMGDRTPPLYRNPNHFTASGAPLVTACKGTQTIVQNGAPVSGSGIAEVTAGGAFTIPAAAATPGVRRGMRRSDFSGEFYNTPPYLYSYTYGTFRNDAGAFGPGQGPGDFSIVYSRKAPVAKAKVTAGANQFGGVMRLLGKMTTRVCFFTKGACSIGGADWKYEVIGAAAYKSVGGAVTAPYTTTYTAIYFHTGVQQPYTLNMIGDRFPWTTGMVTLTAIASGPHPTLEVRTGYDNRTAGGAGTIQMVTPVLTHWLGATTIDTGGVGIVRFTFTPEPGVLAMLVAGLSLCGVLYRARGR